MSESGAIESNNAVMLRLNREGETNVQRLAGSAISRLREHVQMRESALRIARPADPD